MISCSLVIASFAQFTKDLLKCSMFIYLDRLTQLQSTPIFLPILSRSHFFLLSHLIPLPKRHQPTTSRFQYLHLYSHLHLHYHCLPSLHYLPGAHLLHGHFDFTRLIPFIQCLRPLFQ